MLKKHILLSINTHKNVSQLVIPFGDGDVFISLHQQCLSQSKLSLSLSSSSSSSSPPPLLRQLSLSMFSRYLLICHSLLFENILSVILLNIYIILYSSLFSRTGNAVARISLSFPPFRKKNITVFGGSSLTNPSF